MESNKKTNLTPVYILLFIILVVLVIGLFKRELAFSALIFGPQDVKVYKNVDYPCKKEIKNPEYNNRAVEVNKKCLDQSWKNSIFADPPVINRYRNSIKEERDCEIKGFEELKNSGIPENITVDATCTKTIAETWFYALGRNWFKKGEQVVSDTQK